MKHAEIENTMFFIDPDSRDIIRIDKNNHEATPPEFTLLVMGPMTPPAPQFMDLLTAAPTLYQQLTFQYRALETLIGVIDGLPRSKELANLHSTFEQMQNGILLAQQVAQLGIERVANGLDAEKKSK